MSQEWAWAAAIIAVPVILFGAFELARILRHRRYQQIARRSKTRPSGSRRTN